MAATSSEQFWARLENPELYADASQPVSLAAALREAADEAEADVGDIGPGHLGGPLGAGLGAAPDLHREPITILSVSSKRMFTVSGSNRGAQLFVGWTPDLGELVGAAALWRTGAALAEMRHAFPWIEVDDLAYANERGPADAVTVRWERIRAHVREPLGGRPFDLAIRAVEAAYAEPRLRELCPFLSHWALGFSRCTGYPFTRDIPWISYLIDQNRYKIRVAGYPEGGEQVLEEADTAEEAVARVVARLPEGCGPAVAGTADDF